jgi:hypothetical protein
VSILYCNHNMCILIPTWLKFRCLIDYRGSRSGIRIYTLLQPRHVYITSSLVEIPVPYRLPWVPIGNRRLYSIAIEPIQRDATRDQHIESVGAAGPKTPPPGAARPPSPEDSTQCTVGPFWHGRGVLALV